MEGNKTSLMIDFKGTLRAFYPLLDGGKQHMAVRGRDRRNRICTKVGR